ncbi:MAG: Fic family protein [Myxococcota bacterium]
MSDRESREEGGQLPVVAKRDRAPREAANAYEQVRWLEQAIAEGIQADFFRLRPSVLIKLNRLAVAGLVEAPGRFRLGEMIIAKSSHKTPPPEDVAEHIDDMCDYINDNWDKPAVHLAAYVMWRLNWIHPFQDGNGRTARALSYLVLCVRLGRDLPGEMTMPARIAQDKQPYYLALEAADRAWMEGTLDLAELEVLLRDLLVAQVVHAADTPLSRDSGPVMGSPPNRDSGPVTGPTRSPSGSVDKSVASESRSRWSPTVLAALITGGATVIAALIALLTHVKCGEASPAVPKASSSGRNSGSPSPPPAAMGS